MHQCRLGDQKRFLKKKKTLQILLFKNVWLVLYYIITYLYILIYIITSLALNGGGHMFFTPCPRPYFPCLLACLVSSIERLSLHGSPNWKIMDLINSSLNAIDTIWVRRNMWRYLPIRNHDNRYFADWIRLCPGLSKNSENGNSRLKPHKAARHVWSSGKSGQHWDWDY